MAEEQKVLQYFMALISQVKLFHWATTSFAKHKALDDLHSALSDKVDLLVESYIGRTNKQPLKKFTLEMEATSDVTQIVAYLEKQRNYIVDLSKKWNKYPELQNQLQEIATEINKALYLCNLS